MAIIRCLALAAIALSTFQCVCFADDDQSAETAEERQKWIARVTAELANLDEDDRSTEVGLAAFAMARAGEADQAKEITRQLLPPEKRFQALLGIGDALSYNDRLEAALATVDELPEETDDVRRQFAFALVGIRQAQRGDVEDAVGLLPKVNHEGHRGRLLAAIAEAQIKKGKLDAARDTAKQIAEESRRRQIRAKIANARQGKKDPIAEIRSAFLQAQLTAMLLYSATDSLREAMQAIAAAQKNDRAEMKTHIDAAMADAQNSTQMERATTHTLLAVALVEAGDRAAAKDMILKARDANTKEWLGVSHLFGSPILVYLLIRLDMNDELQALMDSLKEAELFGGPIAYHVNVSAIGGAYAELDRLKEAERYYGKLGSPMERINFVTGVLMNLQ